MLICIVSFMILFSLFGELDAFQYSFDMFTNYESGGDFRMDLRISCLMNIGQSCRMI